METETERKTPKLKLSGRQVAAVIALWAIRLSPYLTPRNFDHSLFKLQLVFRDNVLFKGSGGDGLTGTEIYQVIFESLKAIPEIVEWSKPAVSAGNQVPPTDANKGFIDLRELADFATQTLMIRISFGRQYG